MRQAQIEAEPARRGIQHLERFRHGFLADAVTGKNRDMMDARHGSGPLAGDLRQG
jgi:hypothetical protein